MKRLFYRNQKNIDNHCAAVGRNPMKSSVLCICIFLLMIAIAVAGCVSNGNSPAAPSNTSTIPATTATVPITSAPTTQVTMNTTLANEPPFITIDPIGDHRFGDIIFINGTTNLPVTGRLTVQIIPEYFNPYFVPNSFQVATISDIPIVPAPPGANRWSVNVTDDVINHLTRGADDYLVQVQSEENSSIEIDWDFKLLPAATPQFITIDPIGNQTIGDVFFINGTTILPASQILTVFINPGTKNFCGDCPTFTINSLITPNSSGINHWSVNVTNLFNSQLDIRGSPYIVYVLNYSTWEVNNGSNVATQEFNLLPAPIVNSTVR